MSVEVMELFDIFAGTFGKEKAQLAVKDIETLISDHKRELTTKGDLREVELRLTKEIEYVRGEIKEVELKLTKEIEAVKLEVEKVKAGVIKWVAGLLVAQTGAIIAILTLLK